MINALIIEKSDDVAVVTKQINKGDTITYKICNEEKSLVAKEDIQIYHKVAIRDIKKDEHIKKYNQPIGRATTDIEKGMHVHCHNIESIE